MSNYSQEKIERLLKDYHVEEKEIENFMQDLAELKDDIEEKQEIVEENKEEDVEEEYIFNPKNLEILKATKEGKDLIMKAPEMKKEELAKAIREFLKK